MQITDAGKTFIEDVLKQNNANCIRVVFAGQGCCGPKLGLSLDEPHDDDVVQILNGIKVSIENRIVPHTTSLTLDFRTTEVGSGLVMAGQSNC
ncbi:adhesin [Alicyclobacillus sp. ALC3]|uniref:adhesin n=1 Tax=Alicyclobacillus sp. ALC3 TaxID=2796143 RepID=UPI0019D41F8F|nr:adhesin [Alicyclobacillus sp. ALC3]QSO53204.1 adhesin [Alicyclobacillus curvatus]WDL96658.1 adhesin [Alicyclobacillus sp. ALC3]